MQVVRCSNDRRHGHHSAAAAQVPLVRDRAAPRGRLVQTEVWEWQGMGEDQGDEAAAWLSAYLGRPVQAHALRR